MYIKVSLLNGIKEPLSYKSPSEWGLLPLGTLALVPLRNKKEYESENVIIKKTETML